MKAQRVYIHSACHPDALTWTTIEPDREIAVLECSDCERHITTLFLLPENEGGEGA